MGGNYSVSGCKRNHAWFVITSSLLAFLGEARSWNIQTISGSQTANAQIPGFQVLPCVVFFSLLLKGRSFCSKFSASPCVFKIAFWEILKPRLPLPIFHYTNILIYPKLSQYISTDSLVCPNYPTTFLGLTKLYREVFSFAQTIPMHYLLALPKLSRMITVEFFFAPTISCSYILSCHTPVCCNCKNLLKCLNLALDGFQRFQLEYAPRQWEIMHQKKVWFWSGKVARSVNHFWRLHTSTKRNCI